MQNNDLAAPQNERSVTFRSHRTFVGASLDFRFFWMGQARLRNVTVLSLVRHCTFVFSRAKAAILLVLAVRLITFLWFSYTKIFSSFF